MAFASEIHALNVDITHRIAEKFKAVSARLDSYRVYRETLTELNSLSDRELQDIGIHYSMIKAIARETAYGA